MTRAASLVRELHAIKRRLREPFPGRRFAFLQWTKTSPARDPSRARGTSANPLSRPQQKVWARIRTMTEEYTRRRDAVESPRAANRRQRGQVGSCRLCGKPGDLQRSHVLPEFFYRATYEEGLHRFAEASVASTASRFRQKGLRERLLCKTCEGILARWEHYAAPVFRGLESGWATYVGLPAREVDGIDYGKFKLFELSLLWRASVSSLPEFRSVHLGRNENVLRRMLWEQDPGRPTDFPCFLFHSPAIWGELKNSYIIPPYQRRVDGNRVYIFAMAGLFWIFYPSNDPPGAPYAGLSLADDGKLRILLSDAIGKQTWRDLARAVKERVRADKPWPSLPNEQRRTK